MMIGPAILFLLAINIARHGGGWFTGTDLAFLAVLGCVVLGRVVEFRGGDPRTADGQPATPAHLRRFTIVILVLGLGLWTAVNLIGNHTS